MSHARMLRPAHRWGIAGVVVLTLAGVVAEALGLALLSVLLDVWVGVQTVSQSPLLRQLQAYVSANPFVFFLVLGATYVGKSALNLWATYASISLALRIVDEWRLRLFGGLLRVPVRAVPPKQGALLQLVLDEPSVAGGGLGAAGILVQNAASAITVYVTLLWISPRITFALTAISGLAIGVLAVMSRYTRITAEERSRAYGEGYGYLTEMLASLKQVRIFGLESTVEERAASHVSVMRTANRRGSVIASSPRIVIELVFFGSAMVILAVMSPRMGDMTMLSGVALAVVAAIRLLPAFSSAAGTWVQVQQAMPAIRRIRQELDRLESTTEPVHDDDNASPSLERGLDCVNVRFAYPGRPPVLQGVSMRIPAGAFVAIVGPSGSGKSTLVDLLCGLHDPDGGEILVDGGRLSQRSKRAFRRMLGVVTQDSFLMSGTIRDNLCLLRRDCPEDVLQRSLAITGADRVVADLPAGLNTVIGERGVSLSGGQRQRLALARVLNREPQVLILDEATSALDPESDESVYAALEQHRKTMTVIAITHRLSSVRHADRIYVMRDGVVAETGDHEALVRLNGLYAAMLRAAERQTDSETAEVPL